MNNPVTLEERVEVAEAEIGSLKEEATTLMEIAQLLVENSQTNERRLLEQGRQIEAQGRQIEAQGQQIKDMARGNRVNTQRIEYLEDLFDRAAIQHTRNEEFLMKLEERTERNEAKWEKVREENEVRFRQLEQVIERYFLSRQNGHNGHA